MHCTSGEGHEMALVASVHAKAIALIKLSLEMTTAAGSGHPTSAASLAHLVTLLMYHHMRYDPAYPNHPAADRLVLSEGHACPIVYAAAADLGLAIGQDPQHWRPMTRDEALRLRAIDSEIDGHPNPAAGFPFFPAATGSLGQGLSIANGLALAARLDGLDQRIFCLIGDGESREGQIWEAVDFLVDYHLTAVCPIFNCNGYGQSGRVSPQQAPEVTATNFLHDAALQERFFECRIAEQNMLSCAGDLAAGSKLPFVSTSGKFLERGYDQIEMGLMSGFPLKLVGSHVG